MKKKLKAQASLGNKEKDTKLYLILLVSLAASYLILKVLNLPTLEINLNFYKNILVVALMLKISIDDIKTKEIHFLLIVFLYVLAFPIFSEYNSIALEDMKENAIRMLTCVGFFFVFELFFFSFLQLFKNKNESFYLGNADIHTLGVMAYLTDIQSAILIFGIAYIVMNLFIIGILQRVNKKCINQCKTISIPLIPFLMIGFFTILIIKEL